MKYVLLKCLWNVFMWRWPVFKEFYHQEIKMHNKNLQKNWQATETDSFREYSFSHLKCILIFYKSELSQVLLRPKTSWNSLRYRIVVLQTGKTSSSCFVGFCKEPDWRGRWSHTISDFLRFQPLKALNKSKRDDFSSLILNRHSNNFVQM